MLGPATADVTRLRVIALGCPSEVPVLRLGFAPLSRLLLVPQTVVQVLPHREPG